MSLQSSCRVLLPERLSLNLVSEGPETGDWNWDERGTVHVDASAPISHAEPAAMAALAAWTAHLRAQGCTVHVSDGLKSPYAWKYGVLSSLAGRAPPPAPSNDYLPPTVVRSPQEHEALFDRLAPLLHPLSQVQRGVLLQCLGEMLRNVHEHSSSPLGAYVCCSHFPKADRISVAIVDTGVGIPTTIRGRYTSQLSDAQSISLATQWRVSGATATENNAGFGLFVARSTTYDTRGLFTVVSGSGLVRSVREEEDLVLEVPRASWRGTIVALAFTPSQTHAAWTRTNKLLQANISNRKLQPVQWGSPPDGAQRVEIPPTAAGLVEDKEVAKRLRDSVLLPELQAERPVGIDLTKARVITHSFTHALLYKLFILLGEKARRLIHVQAKEPQVKDVVRVVAWYALQERAEGQRGSAPAP